MAIRSGIYLELLLLLAAAPQDTTTSRYYRNRTPSYQHGHLQNKVRRQFCSTVPDSGPCKLAMRRYYYDVYHGDCIAFYYTGCYGNTNNFMSKEDCRNTCVWKPTPKCSDGTVPERKCSDGATCADSTKTCEYINADGYCCPVVPTGVCPDGTVTRDDCDFYRPCSDYSTTCMPINGTKHSFCCPVCPTGTIEDTSGHPVCWSDNDCSQGALCFTDVVYFGVCCKPA